MMDYLKEYNITDDELKDIEVFIKNSSVSIDMFKFNQKDIKEKLDVFKNMGITNFYGILMTRPSLFCDTVESIEKRLNSYENKNELVALINEDAENLQLVGLL
jgi:hypothetical protein